MTLLKISGGRVVDPANGVEDMVGDLWIEGAALVAAPSDPATRPDRTIDARGYVVMPGGVDVHCHIAGSKVNAARALRPEDREGVVPRRPGMRSGTLGSVPSTFATGYRYAGLGYTTAIDAAIAPLGARHAHHELRDTPVIDKGFLALLGNNHLVMDLIHAGETSRLRDYVAWLLGATRAYGVKVVNPGGVELWKQGKGRGVVATLDQTVDGFGVTPRQILLALAEAVDGLGLPHPMHLHGLNLGLPGNASTTLETMQALDGRRTHLAHIQFHSYGGDPHDPATMTSRVPELAEAFNATPGLTTDVGQVLFGRTTSMTADGAVGYFLHRLLGQKWVNVDLEHETGCGIVPVEYKDTNFIHALQWAIGLEWFLRVEDPWRIALSTDHPNGGSFLAYPDVIALLMDRGHRDDALNALPKRARGRTGLGELSREYSLSEIAILTRAAPARMLGLSRKGHLGLGADADLTIYAPDPDVRQMFAMPRYVLKAGRVVLDDGEPRPVPAGDPLTVSPPFDDAIETLVRDRFDQGSSIRFANFPVADADLAVEEALS